MLFREFQDGNSQNKTQHKIKYISIDDMIMLMNVLTLRELIVRNIWDISQKNVIG